MLHRGVAFQFSDKQYKTSHEKRQQRQMVRFPEFSLSTVLSASAVCCGCLTACDAQAFDGDQLTVVASCGGLSRQHRQVAASLKTKGNTRADSRLWGRALCAVSGFLTVWYQQMQRSVFLLLSGFVRSRHPLTKQIRLSPVLPATSFHSLFDPSLY